MLSAEFVEKKILEAVEKNDAEYLNRFCVSDISGVAKSYERADLEDLRIEALSVVDPDAYAAIILKRT